MYGKILLDERKKSQEPGNSNLAVFIEIFNEYQYKEAFVQDRQINFLAMLSMIIKLVNTK
jgi:hypothetical protein